MVQVEVCAILYNWYQCLAALKFNLIQDFKCVVIALDVQCCISKVMTLLHSLC